MKKALVTITVPTYNSARFLRLCLEAIRNQNYDRIEINIVDGYSNDDTIKIAKEFGIKRILYYRGYLLGARYQGVKAAKGDFILILDSDQILEPTTIKRAVDMAVKNKLKMVVLEENVYRHKTFIEKLFDMDRRLFNKVGDLDPYTGVILPRFFESKLLNQAYSRIPNKIFSRTGGPDHAIVYLESHLLSPTVAVLPNAVRHIEPSSLRELWKKFYKWGYTSVTAHDFGRYHTLMSKKERFRTGLFTHGMYIESLGSILLLILKGLAFKLGYLMAQLGL